MIILRLLHLTKYKVLKFNDMYTVLDMGWSSRTSGLPLIEIDTLSEHFTILFVS